jgi:C1A family cysteine protease
MLGTARESGRPKRAIRLPPARPGDWMMSPAFFPRLGWHRDLADPRDLTAGHERVRELFARLPRRNLTRSEKFSRAEKPAKIDLREYFLGVSDARDLRSSTAEACVSLVQYFERRATGRIVDLSPLFLYKVTRRLLGQCGDTGADLRTTLKALARFGAPPVAHGPTRESFDAEPDAFVYALAKKWNDLAYVRLDPAETSGAKTLRTVRSYLAAGFPSVFGFSVPAAISTETEISFPTQFDDLRGGHAVVAVGYDDDRRIRSSKGALLVRNCWGETWGKHGYGWLPYRYVEDMLASDFWTLLRPAWLESGEFEMPV